VRCDRVQWSLFGVSLAGWNLLASLIMAGGCLTACLTARRPASRAAETA
jgi:disulfide bond formation protein DsbB